MRIRFLLNLASLRWVPSAYFPLFIVSCAVLAWHPLSGSIDTWAHAAIGRWIVEHRQVPEHSLFLWSVSPTYPWIYHSWGSQLWFYSLFAWGGERYGPALIIGFTMMAATGSFALSWRLWTRNARPNGFTMMLFLLAMWCSALRFYPRPELFSAVFLSVLLYLLTVRADPEFRRVLQKKDVFTVFVLFFVWANFHGAVALGLLLMVLTVVCDVMQEKCRYGSARLTMRLGLVALGCAVAVCLNPYGFRLWSALKPVGSETFALIDEWKPFYIDPILPMSYVWTEAFLALTAFAAWVANTRRRWAHIAWVAVMFVLFLSARRHLWLCAITSLSVVCANAACWSVSPFRAQIGLFIDRATRGVAKKWLERSAKVCTWLTNAVTLYALCLWLAPSIPGNDGVQVSSTEDSLPESAARWLQEHPSAGNLFTDYANSSYFQWALAGKPPLYIDLLNAYPNSVMTDYHNIISANQRGKRLLNELNITRVVLRPHTIPSNLAPLSLYLDRRWKRVYYRQDGSIWIRRPHGETATSKLQSIQTQMNVTPR